MSKSLLKLCHLTEIPYVCRRLRCARNRLHLHLFASFIVRCTVLVFKHLYFKSGVTSFNKYVSLSARSDGSARKFRTIEGSVITSIHAIVLAPTGCCSPSLDSLCSDSHAFMSRSCKARHGYPLKNIGHCSSLNVQYRSRGHCSAKSSSAELTISPNRLPLVALREPSRPARR